MVRFDVRSQSVERFSSCERRSAATPSVNGARKASLFDADADADSTDSVSKSICVVEHTVDADKRVSGGRRRAQTHGRVREALARSAGAAQERCVVASATATIATTTCSFCISVNVLCSVVVGSVVVGSVVVRCSAAAICCEEA
jgi:hypothetical protein